jgi:DNA-binding XRE family transcriptional regulator
MCYTARMNDETVKRLQAEAMADLQKELAGAKSDPLHHELDVFLTELIKTRMSKKLSQADLAKRTGLHQSAIARIETGRTNPTLHTLLVIAKALNANLMLE